MILEIQKVELELMEQFEKIACEKDLTALRQTYLGRTGKVMALMQNLKNIPNDSKREYGMNVNALKVKSELLFDDKQKYFADQAILSSIKGTSLIDLTVPSLSSYGSLHPITVVQNQVVELFRSMGFVVEFSREIETEYNNFEAVNVAPNHPARDMQDTFFLSNGQVLSTHTSSSQNRMMKKYGAPLKVIFPGRCFRNEELDASHENTFFQFEGMMIDKNINISNLVYFMKEMLIGIFEKEIKVRLRPGYFPFVEPGFELDCSCPYCEGSGCRVCKDTGWIELCPCGMIHPEVLKMGGINPDEYQGFAFGLGLSRLAMMKYEIADIRILNSGNIKQLKQTKIK